MPFWPLRPILMSFVHAGLAFADRYDYALPTLQELPYAVWRNFDPEDPVRFFCYDPKKQDTQSPPAADN